MTDTAELLERLAMELARVGQFGRQSKEHLAREFRPGTTYHAEQTNLAWPERDDSVEWSNDGDYGTSPGRDFFRHQAEGLLEGLEALGLKLVGSRQEAPPPRVVEDAK